MTHVTLEITYFTILYCGLFMLENKHTKSTHGIEVELIHVVKIIKVFEAYPYISVSGCQTLSSFSLESFLTSHEQGRNSSNKIGSNLRVLHYVM